MTKDPDGLREYEDLCALIAQGDPKTMAMLRDACQKIDIEEQRRRGE